MIINNVIMDCYYFKNRLIKYIQENSRMNLLIVSNNIERGVGKTTNIQEVGFYAQSLGCDVVIWTPTITKTEYFETSRIENISDIRGKRYSKSTVVLIDEVNIDLEQNNEIYEALLHSDILLLGYILRN